MSWYVACLSPPRAAVNTRGAPSTGIARMDGRVAPAPPAARCHIMKRNVYGRDVGKLFVGFLKDRERDAYIHTYMHTCMHACMHTCIHTYLPTYLPTYRHTDIQTYRPTDIQTYLHTCHHAGPGRTSHDSWPPKSSAAAPVPDPASGRSARSSLLC